MNQARKVRICFLLAAIFAAGVITGRLSAPKPTPVLMTGKRQAQTPESLAAEFQRRCNLDEEQRQKLVPIFDRMIREMLPYAPLTQERLSIFLRTMERIRPLIRAEQKEAFEKFVKEIADTTPRSGSTGGASR